MIRVLTVLNTYIDNYELSQEDQVGDPLNHYVRPPEPVYQAQSSNKCFKFCSPGGPVTFGFRQPRVIGSFLLTD